VWQHLAHLQPPASTKHSGIVPGHSHTPHRWVWCHPSLEASGCGLLQPERVVSPHIGGEGLDVVSEPYWCSMTATVFVLPNIHTYSEFKIIWYGKPTWIMIRRCVLCETNVDQNWKKHSTRITLVTMLLEHNPLEIFLDVLGYLIIFYDDTQMILNE
jgi:hypothetical protein